MTRIKPLATVAVFHDGQGKEILGLVVKVHKEWLEVEVPGRRPARWRVRYGGVLYAMPATMRQSNAD